MCNKKKSVVRFFVFFQETLGNNFEECGWEDGASTVAR